MKGRIAMRARRARPGPASLWTDLSLRSKGLIVVLVPLVAVLVTIVSSLIVTRSAERADDAHARQTTVTAQVQRLLTLVVDAETGVRGYLLIEDPRFLEPYRRARTQLPAVIASLAAVEGPDDPRVRRVMRLTRAELTLLSKLSRSDDAPEAVGNTLLRRGKALLDQLRGEIAVWLINEQTELAELTQQEQRTLDRAPLLHALALALGIGGGLAAMLLFAGGIGRRVARLTEGAGHLARGRPLSELPPGRDEIGELGRRLSEASHLLAARDRERDSLEQSLRGAKEEAERANMAKSDFLSRMSHELRTPLAAILGFGQLLEMDDLEPKQREAVTQILEAGRHLLELIDEVLDVARIEAGRTTVNLEPIPVAAAITEAVELVGPLALERELELDDRSAAAAGERRVVADRQRLRQVLLNLLSNAIKYNSEGGRVTISCAAADGARLRICVSDTGAGVAREELDRLFEPFDRIGAERSEIAGTGLGLAVAKRLAELMNGALWADSRLGEGSTFFLELPLAETAATGVAAAGPEAGGGAPAREPGAAARPEAGDGTPARELVGATEAAPARAGAPVAGTVAAGPPGDGRWTLLYIEDNSANLRLVERLAERRGDLTLLSAADGRRGLELAREALPDLVLLDLDLPDLPGTAVLEELRSDERTSALPVVVISADATTTTRERLQDAGVQDFLTKPLDVSVFYETVDRILGGRPPNGARA